MPLGFSIIGSTVTFDIFLRWETQGPLVCWKKRERKNLMSGSDGCRGGGSRLSLVVLVSEKLNLVSEKSGKSQGILFICSAGNPAYCRYVWGRPKVSNVSTQRFILLTYVCNCVKWRSQLLGGKWLVKRWC